MIVHLVGLPHTQFDKHAYSACAFTAKAVRLAEMLRSRGIEVTTYWGGDQADVSLLTVEEQRGYFGEWDPARLPVVVWDARRPEWRLFHARAARELEARVESGPDHVVALVGGGISQELVDPFVSRVAVVEPGVGYEGLCRDTFACFESYAWMHNRYGAHGIGDGRALDAVIPNAVDPREWTTASSAGYALYVGRLVARKGPHVAGQIAEAAGLPLRVAGAGAAEVTRDRITATDGTTITCRSGLEYVGVVSGLDRRFLFAQAEVLICPTLYVGPWEGVHAEAMMSGVPVVAPDYGAFTETLPRRQRYRSLQDAVRAVKSPVWPRGTLWRTRARELCGIDRCADLYADWLDRVRSVRDGRNGWYAP